MTSTKVCAYVVAPRGTDLPSWTLPPLGTVKDAEGRGVKIRAAMLVSEGGIPVTLVGPDGFPLTPGSPGGGSGSAWAEDPGDLAAIFNSA